MLPKFFILYGNQKKIVPEIGKFPGGEIRVRIPEKINDDTVLIYALLLNSDDVMTLVMLVDALREMNVHRIRLTMPYIPYARQDRVCNEGEAFSLRAFTNIINSLGFSSIVVYDPHSKVASDMMPNSIQIAQATLFASQGEVMNYLQMKMNKGMPLYILSPDKGAVKKAESFLDLPYFKGVIYAEKERDLATGKIIRTVIEKLPSDINDASVIIADDICDGGRTFIEIAKKIRPYCRELNLYVTHGIFSQGMEVFDPFFDNVWCSINFKDYQ